MDKEEKEILNAITSIEPKKMLSLARSLPVAKASKYSGLMMSRCSSDINLEEFLSDVKAQEEMDSLFAYRPFYKCSDEEVREKVIWLIENQKRRAKYRGRNCNRHTRKFFSLLDPKLKTDEGIVLGMVDICHKDEIVDFVADLDEKFISTLKNRHIVINIINRASLDNIDMLDIAKKLPCECLQDKRIVDSLENAEYKNIKNRTQTVGNELNEFSKNLNFITFMKLQEKEDINKEERIHLSIKEPKEVECIGIGV
ncbi:MAG: hypothetical protein N4A43_03520 [Alphaproteobacteria bacterium]|jgi:hypothetical protein|nr:hypothetical protein [Alphaproteobacteria bacterium]